MEYTIIRRYKFNGLEDNLSIQKTAQSLEEALKYTTALKMLETSKSVEFNILINIEDAFKYINEPLILNKKSLKLTKLVLPYIQLYGETRKKSLS